MQAAVNFYNSLFEKAKPLQVLESGRMTFWQFDHFGEEEATNGNGTIIGFDVGSAEAAKQFCKQAIALGGSCAGEHSQKGPRFSGYVSNLDNNKLGFFV